MPAPGHGHSPKHVRDVLLVSNLTLYPKGRGVLRQLYQIGPTPWSVSLDDIDTRAPRKSRGRLVAVALRTLNVRIG